MKKLFKTKQEAIISSIGLVVIFGVFIYWWANDDAVNIAGHVAALCSVVLFTFICLKFVPNWLEFWSKHDEEKAVGAKPKKGILIRIFLAFLAVDALSIVIIHYVRVFVFKDTTTFYEGLKLFLHTDAGAYLGIAESGYAFDRNLVFYPGYPILVSLFNYAINDYMLSGIAVSALFYALSACVLYKLMILDFKHSDAIRAVEYFAILPGAFFFVCPMSESLFFFLCVSSIYLVRSEKWLPACLAGAYCAFTRSLGVLVFAPLFFEAVRNRSLKQILMCFIVPLGTVAYLHINYRVAGDFFAFSKLEEEYWGQSAGLFFDTTAFQIDNALADIQQPWYTNALGLWLPNVAWCFGALLLMCFAAKELRTSYMVWFICYYVIAIGATYLISAPRYLIACVPIYPAIVIVTINKKTRTIMPIICAVFALFYLFAFAARWEVF